VAYCHKCGKKNTEADKFCAHCGAKLGLDSDHHHKKDKKIGSLVLIILLILFIGYIFLDVWAITQVTPIITFGGLISTISNFDGGVTLSRTHASSTLRFENPTFVPILFGRIVCVANYGDTTVAEANTGYFIMGANSEKDIPVELKINNINAVTSIGKGLWNAITGRTERAYIDVYVDFLLFKIKVRTIG
jgi:LEA14-like dessication related protein